MKTVASKFFDKGFTLVELLVVMTIMGVLMTLAATVLQEAGKGKTTESAMQQMEALIREARTTAIGNDCPVRLVIVKDKKNRSQTSGHLRSLSIMRYAYENRRDGKYDATTENHDGRWKTVTSANLPPQIYVSPHYSLPLEWSGNGDESMLGQDTMKMAGRGKTDVYYLEFDEKGRFVSPMGDPLTPTRPQRLVLMTATRASGRGTQDGLRPARLDAKKRPVGAKGLVIWPSGDTGRLRTIDQVIKKI